MKKNQLKNATVLQRAVVKKKEIRIEMPSQKEVVVDNNKTSDYYICTNLIVRIPHGEQILTPGDVVSYPLNNTTVLDVRIPDQSYNIYDERTKAAMIIQRFWKNRIIRKFVNVVEMAQEHQVKRFARIGWAIMIMLGVAKEVVKWRSNGRYDIMSVVLLLSFFLLFLIFARTLVLGNQMRYYTYVSWGLWYVFYAAADSIVWQMMRGFDVFGTIMTSIGFPIIIFFFCRVLNIFATILQYEYKENIKQLSSTLSGRFLAALPVIILFALQAQLLRFALPILQDSMCELMPGANPPSTTNPWWTNCTENINKMNVYYPAKPTSIHEIELKRAIEDYVPVWNQMLFQRAQAMEPMFLLITSQILFRVCRLTIRDILAIRTSFWELTVVIVTVSNLLVVFLGGSIGMKPGFSSPAAYDFFASTLMYTFVYWPLMLIRFIALYLLIKNGQKCMNMEINGGDPHKYSYGVRVIHKRKINVKTKPDIIESPANDSLISDTEPPV